MPGPPGSANPGQSPGSPPQASPLGPPGSALAPKFDELVKAMAELAGVTAEMVDMSRKQMTDERKAGERPKAASPGPIAKAAGAGADYMGTMVTGLMSKIAGPFAAMELLGQMLQSVTSGFGPFMMTVKMFATTLSGLLMPAFVVLAGVMFALVMMLNSAMDGPLKEFFGTSLTTALTLLKSFGKTLEEVDRTFQLFGMSLMAFVQALMKSPIGSLVGKSMGLTPQQMADSVTGAGTLKAFNDGLEAALAKSGAKRPKREEDGPENFGGGDMPELDKMNADAAKRNKKFLPDDFFPTVMKGMQLAIDDMNRQLNGSVGRMSISQARAAAQTAALNMSPFEQEILKIQRAQLELFQQVFNNLKPAVGF